MVIFGKKKERDGNEIPNLPELPSLSDDSQGNEPESPKNNDYSYDSEKMSNEIKDLPSFPDSDFGDSLSQEAVKSAIEPQKMNMAPVINHEETKFVLPKSIQKPVSLNFQKTVNRPIYEETVQPVYSPLPKVEPVIPTRLESNPTYPSAPKMSQKSNEPVYIRIDKFKFALDSFQSVKEKINEVERYLQQIKEQKKREDEELKEWENEIESIKLRIEGIDNKIFSKV